VADIVELALAFRDPDAITIALCDEIKRLRRRVAELEAN